MTKGWILLLLSLNNLIGYLTADGIRTAFLRPVLGQEVTAFRSEVFSGSAELECVAECLKYDMCNSVAFVPSSKTCFLELTLRAAADPGASALIIWEKTEPVCRDEPVIAVANGHVEPVQRTMTSVSARVTCDEDFFWTGGDAGVECLSDGTWTTDKVCQRYKWTNPTGGTYPVPRPPDLTWKMCLRAALLWDGTSSTSLVINVYGVSQDRLMKMDINYSPSAVGDIELVSYFDGSWIANQVIDNFPFPLNQEFVIVISAASEYLLNVYVDGTFFADYVTQKSIRDITRVNTYATNADRLELNLWCTSA